MKFETVSAVGERDFQLSGYDLEIEGHLAGVTAEHVFESQQRMDGIFAVLAVHHDGRGLTEIGIGGAAAHLRINRACVSVGTLLKGNSFRNHNRGVDFHGQKGGGQFMSGRIGDPCIAAVERDLIEAIAKRVARRCERNQIRGRIVAEGVVDGFRQHDAIFGNRNGLARDRRIADAIIRVGQLDGETGLRNVDGGGVIYRISIIRPLIHRFHERGHRGENEVESLIEIKVE